MKMAMTMKFAGGGKLSSKIVINATNVSQDILLWLHRTDDGHYFIERRLNRDHARSIKHPISITFAEKLLAMTTEEAWKAMEESITGPY